MEEAGQCLADCPAFVAVVANFVKIEKEILEDLEDSVPSVKPVTIEHAEQKRITEVKVNELVPKLAQAGI